MRIKLFFLLLSLVVSLVACNNANVDEKVEEAFELGVTTDGHYHNAYFDLEIYFDPTWNIQKQAELMKEVGAPILVGDNKELNVDHVNTTYLLTVLKHPTEAQVLYNPKFTTLVENVRSFPDIETGADYLSQTQKSLGQTAMTYDFEEVYEKRIGTKMFHVLKTQVTYMGMEVHQDYYSTIDRGFCLSFILGYHTPKEQEELLQIINKVRI
ncbi:MAG: hypothetical protein AB8E82_12105 [Aureispira sp.]